jgi:hypothetical protein
MRYAMTGMGLVAGFLLAAGSSSAAEPAEAVIVPEEVAGLMLNAETWTNSQVNTLALYLRASMYAFVPAELGPVFYEAGNPMLMLGSGYGQVFEVGDTVRDGVYWNFSRDESFIRIGDGPEATRLPPGSLLIVGGAIAESPVQHPGGGIGAKRMVLEFTQTSAGVACGPGYYSCCYVSGSAVRAACIKNDSPDAPDCYAGGPTSLSCALRID